MRTSVSPGRWPSLSFSPSGGGGNAIQPSGADPNAVPVFNPLTDTLLLNDSLDSYATIADMNAAGPYGMFGTGGGTADHSLITPGRNGSGKAMRMFWPAWTGQYTTGLDIFSPGGVPHVIIQWWYRINPSGIQMQDSGMKWAEIWRVTGPRWTLGVGNLTGFEGPTGFTNTGNTFAARDQGWIGNPDGKPDWNPFVQNVSNGGRFKDTNDGNWHSYTLETWLVAGKGVRIWTDSVLRTSTWDGAPGVPSGGMYVLPAPQNTVDFFRLGDVEVDAPSPNTSMTIDYDDFLCWIPGP